MSVNASLKRLKLSTFKLNTLLSFTQAINKSRSTQGLLARYEEILRDDLGIDRILFFYKYENGWECILRFGVPEGAEQQINVEEELLPISEITFTGTSSKPVMSDFDLIIPIIQDDKPLAFVFIGDIDDEEKGVSASIKHLNFIQTLSIIMMVAVENIRFFEESLRQEAMRKELELASRMQAMLIPLEESLVNDSKVKMAAYYRPHFEVGGDYYDVVKMGKEQFGFCIADVSGKGISAAILMSNFQASLRALFTKEISLHRLIEKLNERVFDTAKGEKFITLFIARYNERTHMLEYVNAGHNPPIFYNMKLKKLSLLSSGCIGLGMLEEIPTINGGKIEIAPSSKILCYTDGLVEVLRDTVVEFNLQAIENQVANNRSVEDNLQSIIETQRLNTDNAEVFDDISIVGLQFS
ncbi:MAG TPA: SpoIIE family protein phosphatase [Williamwhitmania sp.]|jgi:sigma-B regulation protein RsbU (phosphoserine phosphatase)|nr:SpoIIE family protein phosphatase [Williamwhitmania sp.]